MANRIILWRRGFRPPRARFELASARLATSRLASSFAFTALAAVAVGGMAIGALAVRRLAVKVAHFGRLEIDELQVGQVLGPGAASVLPHPA
jgi:hypothetical protein